MGLSEAGSPTNQNRARAETYQSFIQLPWLKGENQLPKVIEGVTFKDGIEVIAANAQDAA